MEIEQNAVVFLKMLVRPILQLGADWLKEHRLHLLAVGVVGPIHPRREFLDDLLGLGLCGNGGGHAVP